MEKICRIPQFRLTIKPLNEALKSADIDQIYWMEELQNSFQKIKELLTKTPTLGILTLTKPFTLFIVEKQRFAIGVLIKKLGPFP